MMRTHRVLSCAVGAVSALLLVGLAPAASAAVAAGAPADTGAAVVTAKKKKPSLTVSKTKGLNPNGATVTVKGTGFDVNKGIYVAFCVVPPAGQLPTPCGGGMPTNAEEATTLSHWISSNPPPYGVDLAKPFGRKGSFSVKLRVSPVIGTGADAVDCRVAKCAVVARADHTRTTDRSQDVIVPVTFAK